MRFCVFVILFFTLFFAHVGSTWAGVIISEIMYDLEGSDSGREWVEIQNDDTVVDLTGWKFFEGGVNHGLTLIQGDISLLQNGFAVIADNAEKFLLDWPGFSGMLFDSVFSLSNTGETLVLRNAELAAVDSVTYSSEWGANGDGKSLQKNGNEWIVSLPTAGEQNSEKVAEEEVSPPLPFDSAQGGQGGAGVGSEEGRGGSTPPFSPVLFSAYAGEDKFALAGAEVYFEGQVKGVADGLVNTVRFSWNFGDGIVGEGKNTKHIFQYPGAYIVNLNVSMGIYSSSDFLKVDVFPAKLIFSEIKPGEWVKLKNDSNKVVDISGFGIQVNDSNIFYFPKNSGFAANSFLTLDSSTLNIEIPDSGEAKILYPNGKVLTSFKIKEPVPTLVGDTSLSKGEEIKGSPLPLTPQSLKTAGQAKGGGVGVGGQEGEASAINSQSNISFWSEIKWLIFGLGTGILIGAVYLFIKYRMFAQQSTNQNIS